MIIVSLMEGLVWIVIKNMARLLKEFALLKYYYKIYIMT